MDPLPIYNVYSKLDLVVSIATRAADTNNKPAFFIVVNKKTVVFKKFR